MTAKEIKKRLAKKHYKNRCYVCHKKFGKYFAFHHLYYEEKDAIYKNFKNTNTYHTALEGFINSKPKRFLLLCRAHHHLVEWASSMKDQAKWKRFVKARSLTKT